jgi:hypothetical protein
MTGTSSKKVSERCSETLNEQDMLTRDSNAQTLIAL